ncbi:MAG: nitroreductase [Treponema sp.]|jgi:nitroreductase|nr:nitroreductase [Treponema sp.]
MNNPVLEAISKRRSIRSYTDQQISREQFEILLKAAAEAPSARNAQPWHFSVVQNTAIFKEINQDVSKNLNQDTGDIFHGAPAAIFLSCDPVARWARLDCGIAAENIALAAYSIGLGTVILGRPDPAFTGPRKDYFDKLLKFPQGYSFAVAIAVGVPAGTKDAHPLEPDRITYIG